MISIAGTRCHHERADEPAAGLQQLLRVPPRACLLIGGAARVHHGSSRFAAFYFILFLEHYALRLMIRGAFIKVQP